MRTLLLFLFFLQTAVVAADLESQHALEFVLEPRQNVEWTIQGRMRARSDSTDLYQLRAGTSVDIAVPHGMGVLLGYVITDQEGEATIWDQSHRAYTGLSIPLRQGPTSVFARSVYERFFRSGEPDSSRYRQRLRVELNQPLRPFVSVEALLDAHGLQTSRYTGGVTLHSASRAHVQLSYVYDLRKQSEGGPRHFIATSLILRHARPEP